MNSGIAKDSVVSELDNTKKILDDLIERPDIDINRSESSDEKKEESMEAVNKSFDNYTCSEVNDDYDENIEDVIGDSIDSISDGVDKGADLGDMILGIPGAIVGAFIGGFVGCVKEIIGETF